MENQRDPEKETPSDQEGESRREFIKKLPYIAPVVQTFLLSETAFGGNDDDQGGNDDNQGGNDNQGEDDNDQGGDHDEGEGDGGRRRRRVSPHNRGRGRG